MKQKKHHFNVKDYYKTRTTRTTPKHRSSHRSVERASFLFVSFFLLADDIYLRIFWHLPLSPPPSFFLPRHPESGTRHLPGAKSERPWARCALERLCLRPSLTLGPDAQSFVYLSQVYKYRCCCVIFREYT